MSPAVQHASLAAWSDEAHVRENRARYRRKFEAVVPMLEGVMGVARPDAGFYLWARVPAAWGDADDRFARDLIAGTNVAVLPGRYLGRSASGPNPGEGYVRMALVPSVEECIAAAERVAAFTRSEHRRYADTRA